MKNKAQVIIIAFSIILIVGAFGAFYLINKDSGTNQTTENTNIGTVTIWGTQPESRYLPVFELYTQQQKIGISYQQKNPSTLTNELFAAIARGNGPDAVITSVDWISANRDIITPAPLEIITPEELRSAYVDVASNDLPYKGSIWGLPVALDPLMLYWNKDLFNAAPFVLPPKDWEEAQSMGQKLTRAGNGGSIEQSGIALGRAKNIPLARDIVSLLLVQLGGTIENNQGTFLFESERNHSAGESDLDFYTNFGNQKQPVETDIYTWHGSLPEPRKLFIEGKLGMMIDYLSYAPILKSQNPHLSFDVAPTPQLKNSEFPIYYANLEAIAVLKQSKQQSIVWKFAKSLSGIGAATTLLSNKTIDISPRRDALTQKPFITSPFAELYQKIALNTRRPYDTHPEQNKKYINEMIEAVADGRLTSSAAIQISQQKSALENQQ